MDKQSWHAESAAEDELSKEAITALLTASPSNVGEMLRQENVQRFLLHLVATDQQWRMDYSTNLLQSLSKAIRTHAYKTYSWELRSLLIQTWGLIPSLRNSQFIHSWLDIRWSELGKFLSLVLPEEWNTIALTLLLHTTVDVPAKDVVSIANYHPDLFESVLRQLMKTSATQKVAIDFATILVEQGYSRKVQLLEIMFITGTLSRETMETLLIAARLEPRNVVNLLENHCRVLLSKYELPPTLVRFIRQYLVNFDVDYLQADRTKELLQRVQLRDKLPVLRLPADIRAYVQGWLRITELIEQPAKGRYWLQDADSSIRQMPLLEPETQRKLTEVLVPRLVELVYSEMDLCRVMDNLGRLLMGEGTGTQGPDLLLLEQVTGRVSMQYGRERPPQRLVPYIKVVLEVAHPLPSPEKEGYIYRCLYSLLRSINIGTLNLIKANSALWPLDSQAEWKAFLSQHGLATMAEIAEETGQLSLASQQSTMQSLSSAVGQGTNAHHSVAVVNQQPISFEQYRKMYYIKALYRQYEDNVQQRTANRDRIPSKTKESSVQVTAQQLQQEALDDLVNDVLIREEITELIQQNHFLALSFDPNSQLSPIFQDFKGFFGIHYATLLNRFQLSDADILSALRMFVQRNLFDLYLQQQRKSFNTWRKERKRRAKIAVDHQYGRE